MSVTSELTRVRVVRSERRTCPFALAVFLAVYAAALFLVLAPHKTFFTEGKPMLAEGTVE
jgi:hypothetical protein